MTRAGVVPDGLRTTTRTSRPGVDLGAYRFTPSSGEHDVVYRQGGSAVSAADDAAVWLAYEVDADVVVPVEDEDDGGPFPVGGARREGERRLDAVERSGVAEFGLDPGVGDLAVGELLGGGLDRAPFLCGARPCLGWWLTAARTAAPRMKAVTPTASLMVTIGLAPLFKGLRRRGRPSAAVGTPGATQQWPHRQPPRFEARRRGGCRPSAPL
jgi:hypothetical protein